MDEQVDLHLLAQHLVGLFVNPFYFGLQLLQIGQVVLYLTQALAVLEILKLLLVLEHLLMQELLLLGRLGLFFQQVLEGSLFLTDSTCITSMVLVHYLGLLLALQHCDGPLQLLDLAVQLLALGVKGVQLRVLEVRVEIGTRVVGVVGVREYDLLFDDLGYVQREVLELQSFGLDGVGELGYFGLPTWKKLVLVGGDGLELGGREGVETDLRHSDYFIAGYIRIKLRGLIIDGST